MTEDTGREKIVWAVLCLLLVIWGLTDVRQRAHFDPILAAENPALISKHRTDLTVFTEAGAAFFDGRDPYEVTNPRGWMYLYPPLFAILMAPLHTLPPQWQGVVWYFLSLAMAWGCYRETVRLLKHAAVIEFTRGVGVGKTFRWIQVAVVTVILFPTLDCLQRGQVGILILYLLLLGLRLVLEGASWRKPMVGGMVLSLSIVFKIIPALPVFFLLFLLAVHRIQKTGKVANPFRLLSAGTGVLAGFFLFFFLVPSMFIGWQSNAGHLKTWSSAIGTQAVEASVEGHFANPHSPRNQSLSNALYLSGTQLAYWFPGNSEPNPWRYIETAGRFMVSPPVTNTILAIRVSLCLLLIPLAWKRSGDALDRLAVFGLACAAMLIVSPVSRGHYFMLELPAVLFVSLWVWKNMGPQKALLCAAIPAILSLMHYIFITFPQMFGYIKLGIFCFGTLGIGTALWFVVMTCVLVTFSPEKASRITGTEPSE
jgi:hypothetical protein